MPELLLLLGKESASILVKVELKRESRRKVAISALDGTHRESDDSRRAAADSVADKHRPR